MDITVAGYGGQAQVLALKLGQDQHGVTVVSAREEVETYPLEGKSTLVISAAPPLTLISPSGSRRTACEYLGQPKPPLSSTCQKRFANSSWRSTAFPTARFEVFTVRSQLS